MDRHLNNAQKIINIVWALLLIAAIIGTVYSVWKQNEKDNPKYRLKNTIRRSKKNDKYLDREDETTLIEYPKYDFKEENIINFQPSNKPLIENLYGYDDLVRNVDNDKFLDHYVLSLKTALLEKKKIYKNLMTKAKQQYDIESAKESDANHSLVLSILKVEYIEFPIILNSIGSRLKKLNRESMRNSFKQMLNHKKYGLATIIGRQDIKNFIAEEIFSFYRDPKPSYTTIRNFAILGPSGIGKNKLGECLSYAYCKSGILARNKFTMMNAHDLVSQYVSGTAHLAHSRLVSHLEGIILIDEAYQLTTPNVFGTPDHGKDAITAIVGFITKYTGLSRIGALGYVNPMEKQFFGANDGMKRRFPHKIVLNEYTPEELSKILIRLIAETSNTFLSDKEGQAIYSMINSSLQIDKNIFPTQAGDMHNLASTICQTITTVKDKEWKTGDSKNNIDLLLHGFNRYLSQHNRPILAV